MPIVLPMLAEKADRDARAKLAHRDRTAWCTSRGLMQSHRGYQRTPTFLPVDHRINQNVVLSGQLGRVHPVISGPR